MLGYLIRGPIGGMAWHHLHYLVGLRQLGHDVRFVEDSDDYPACYDPSRHVISTDARYGLAFAAAALERLELGTAWAYYDAHKQRWSGPAAMHADEFCRSADVVLNISGSNPIRPWTASAPVRAYIDTDPAFTQVKMLTNPATRAHASRHNAFLTFGENIPRGATTLTSDGLPWRRTRQPIVLSQWPVSEAPARPCYTTVMQWDSYAAVGFDGVAYGTKSVSLQPFIDFPRRVAVPLELAIGSDSAPRDLLTRHGWTALDPTDIGLTPWTYQDYIQRSRGEFTVAKHGYVVSRCGWFSERSAAYLASGKPVITQNTGFSDWLPTGEGVLSFDNPDGAAAAIELVESDYARHARAARKIAEEHFDSNVVLPDMLASAVNAAEKRTSGITAA